MPSRIRKPSGPFPAGLLALLSAAAVAVTAASAPERPKVGDRAPDFRLEGLGKSLPRAVSLKGLEGQVVLLDFWASWCGPCKRTLPELARMGARHPGLQVLAVSLDENRNKALGFLKGLDTGLSTLHDAGQKVAASYDLAGMPAAVLIDRKGVLRARFDGYTERDLKRLEAEARKLLEEKP